MYKPHIVILGAGYSGLTTATKLQKILHQNEANITLVNKHDYHYQTTWLHETAAGSLKPERTMIPIRDIINQEKINFVIDEVTMIDEKNKKVKLLNQEISYDILVIGLGFEAEAITNPDLNEHVFPIGNLNNARVLREHLEYNFAKYANEVEKNAARINIVIAGGGFTGIEYAGELADRIPELGGEYDVDRTQVRIIMVECESTILPGCEQEFVNYAMNSLESRGVEFITDARIVESKHDRVMYEKEGKQIEIPAKTIVWTAGVRGNSLLEHSSIPTVNGKVEVSRDLRVPGYENVYVLGDCALITNAETGRPCPANAETAIASAVVAARNIKAQINEEALQHFQSEKKAIIASLGSSDGVAVSLNGKKHFGWKATFMKKLSLNRYLLQLGGIYLLMKKGRFNIFHT
ncbi:NAD(P)/FAD-dependent oxidoreductase [Oceanobacillus alkalisoli]|uniref:NAD(P)/FAD-dependent oxidoreductase n=1 Tax=Oceanobacillus alkalisoli TaxID=2925113 RepID=UPI001EF0DB58|nr:NAD(P)/FAD-dependent oxidoreductase [Oceanobacillus alkalisoli]MCF3943268.1 NAD(P)/FAD-dependent oxidoreductase [Oceanobacillus alkalisoli]MCG5103855.1 NAD(P)/FAD-dependent oxidoreductase [Oceanobacillus alkalisoli]